MTQQNAIQLFEGKQVRIAWDEREEKYYFSIVDVVQILTEQATTRKASTYWSVLKGRLKEEGADELLTNCKQLKLPAADGKNYKTDVADLQHRESKGQGLLYGDLRGTVSYSIVNPQYFWNGKIYCNSHSNAETMWMVFPSITTSRVGENATRVRWLQVRVSDAFTSDKVSRS